MLFDQGYSDETANSYTGDTVLFCRWKVSTKGKCGSKCTPSLAWLPTLSVSSLSLSPFQWQFAVSCSDIFVKFCPLPFYYKYTLYTHTQYASHKNVQNEWGKKKTKKEKKNQNDKRQPKSKNAKQLQQKIETSQVELSRGKLEHLAAFAFSFTIKFIFG